MKTILFAKIMAPIGKLFAKAIAKLQKSEQQRKS